MGDFCLPTGHGSSPSSESCTSSMALDRGLCFFRFLSNMSAATHGFTRPLQAVLTCGSQSASGSCSMAAEASPQGPTRVTCYKLRQSVLGGFSVSDLIYSREGMEV